MPSRRRALGALLALSAGLTGLSGPRFAMAQADPAGTLAVPRGRDLALVRADGSEERTLLSVEDGSFVNDAAWSPDGGQIAFSRYTARPGEVGGTDIAVVGPAGGEARVLVPRDPSGAFLGVPAWAPDGSGLVFESAGYSSATGQVERVEWVAADGSGRRTLVDGGRGPTISADGSTVAYLKSGPNGDALWARPLNGGGERQVLAEYELLAVMYPRFAPDGTRLALAGVGSAGRGTAQGPRRVDQAAARSDAGPHPLLSLHGIPSDLFLVDASGANLRLLALLTEDDAAVAWSPDGRWIGVSGASGLRIVSAADGSVRVVSSVGSYGAIDWR